MADSILSTVASTVSAVGHHNPDQRVRLRPAGGITSYASSSPLLTPLVNTNGMMFPYTPSITSTNRVEYGSENMAHTIQDFRYFIRNNSPTFNVSGMFTNENDTSASYTFACIHFLRSVSKMHFGGFNKSSTISDSSINSSLQIGSLQNLISSVSGSLVSSDSLVGAPPKTLILNGYGKYMINNIHCLLTSFSIELPSDVDYVETTINSNKVWMPVVMNLSLELVMQNTPDEARRFNYDDFKNGSLLRNGGWF